jgi:hypothetical protein
MRMRFGSRSTLGVCTRLVALVVVPAGCHSNPVQPASTDPTQVVSVLDTGVPIGAPDTVGAGVSFTVTFSTTEGGCHSPDSVSVVVQGAAATLTPYDTYTGGPDAACPDDVFDTLRSATVTFTQPGPATLTVQGANWFVMPGGTISWVSLTRSVTVSP